MTHPISISVANLFRGKFSLFATHGIRTSPEYFSLGLFLAQDGYQPVVCRQKA